LRIDPAIIWPSDGCMGGQEFRALLERVAALTATGKTQIRTGESMKLEGKVAVITGAARGLGRAYALHLAKIGADVVINDIALDAANEYGEELTAPTVMDEIRGLGRRSIGIAADVTDPDQVNGMFEEVLGEFGRVDILVTNAGGALVRGPSFASSIPEDAFRKMMDINLMGTIFCCQAVAGPMKEQRSGKIVTVGSQAGLRSSAQSGGGGVSYSVSKAAIHQYTRHLAAELGPYNINVNCIAPAWILSSRAIAQGRNSPETRARLEEEIALKRLGEPEDCAKVVEFLVTDLSDYVTGQVIRVCGGCCLF
jgi:NAD(P)-dependent dehydrogenase (short-subunit alcohol dehydrogenase family)